MTEKTDQLAQVMDQVEALETTIALNNLIAGGAVSDPQIIADAAAASSMLLMMQLVGLRLMFNGDPEMKELFRQATDIVLND